MFSSDFFLSFFLSFFISLLATLRENGWTDLHEIFREGVESPWNDLITVWVNSGKPRDATMLSPAIAQMTGVNKSVPFARWQQVAGFVVLRTTACSNFARSCVVKQFLNILVETA